MKDFQKLPTKNLLKFKKFLLRFRKYLPLGIILSLTAFFAVLNSLFNQIDVKLSPKSEPFSITNLSYPIIQRQFIPTVSAEAAYVLDDTSKVVLFSKNKDLRFSPASTTKIMTALVALDYYNLGDILTVERKSDPDWSVMGLTPGEQINFEGLLYGMMLPSGDDAAFAIADNYPGGEIAFVEKMNEKAKLLNLYNTHFGDPVGLEDDKDYTTAKDLSILSSYAITHPLLSQIVNTKEITVADTWGNSFHLQNLNILLGFYGVNGLKTGYTQEAGQVLVTTANINGHTIIIVVMKSQDRFSDTEKLLQFVNNNIIYLPIYPK